MMHDQNDFTLAPSFNIIICAAVTPCYDINPVNIASGISLWPDYMLKIAIGSKLIDKIKHNINIKKGLLNSNRFV